MYCHLTFLRLFFSRRHIWMGRAVIMAVVVVGVGAAVVTVVGAEAAAAVTVVGGEAVLRVVVMAGVQAEGRL
jgi:hypothetical protein